MTSQEQAYSEIERLLKSFKGMPAAQRKGLNEMQTRLSYVLPITNQTHFAKNGTIMQIRAQFHRYRRVNHTCAKPPSVSNRNE